MLTSHRSFQQIKRLSFDGLKLLGRDEELETIQQILDHASVCCSKSITTSATANHVVGEAASSRTTTTPLILIRGYSGVGKSALLQSAFGDEEKCCVCLGKHEQQQQQTRKQMNQSNNKWNEVLESLVSSLEEYGDRLLDQIKKDLKVALDAQHIRQLTGTFPVMGRVLASQRTSHVAASCEQFGSTKAAMVRLIRVVAKNLAQMGRVLVLVLEDLQWSDYTALALLLALATEPVMNGLVLVGTYRHNEVRDGSHHILSQFLLSELRERNCNVTNIELQNLGLEPMNEIVSSLMMMKPERTLDLSKVVMRKTDGNVFYALQLLRILNQEALLVFSVETYEWEWDLERIAAETSLRENVAEMVTHKLNKLPPLSKRVLMIGSCIGAKFHDDLITGVLKALLEKERTTAAAAETQSGNDNDEQTHEHESVDFKGMIEDGLLTCHKGFYRFSHDRIEQAAHELFGSESEREDTHFVIGRFLQDRVVASGGVDIHLGPYNEESVKMLCCQHLNLGFPCMERSSSSNPQVTLDLAKLNLEAGEIASRRSALQATIGFLQFALSLLNGLGRDPWTEHYDLVLKIHNLLAAMLNIRGDHDEADAIIATVLRRARTEREKRRAFAEKVNLLVGQNQIKEAQQFGIKSLKKAGVKLPSGKVRSSHLLLQFFQLKRKINKLGKSQKDGILRIPECRDDEKKAIILIMNEVAYASFFLDESDMMTAICLRGLSLSLKFGLSQYASLCLAMYGCFLGAMGDFDAAYTQGNLAVRLVERYDSKGESARTMSTVFTFIKPLKEPLRNCLDGCLKYYAEGMESGDIEFAICIITLYTEIYLFVGLPLVSLLEDLEAYKEQLKRFENTIYGCIFEAFSQGIHCIWGNAPDPFMLNGEIIQEHIFLQHVRDNFVARWGFYFVKLYVAYHLNQGGPEMERAAEAFWDLKNPLAGAPNFFRINLAFLNGMVAMAMEAKRGPNRKYRRIREESIRFIKLWEKKGVPWVSHMVLILCAERDRWDPKKGENEIKAAYDAAIRSASSAGYVNDCALANERCARYFLTQVGDEGQGYSYMKNAISLYWEWGANAKVSFLRDEFPGASNDVSCQPPSSADCLRRSTHSDAPPLGSSINIAVEN